MWGPLGGPSENWTSWCLRDSAMKDLKSHRLLPLPQITAWGLFNIAIDIVTCIINQVGLIWCEKEYMLCVLILSIIYWGNLFSNSGIWCLKTFRAPLVRVGYRWRRSWFLVSISCSSWLNLNMSRKYIGTCTQIHTKISDIGHQICPLPLTNSIFWKEVPCAHYTCCLSWCGGPVFVVLICVPIQNPNL